MSQPLAAPITEKGYVLPVSPGATPVDWWGVWEQFEQAPELTWPHSVAIYTRMKREDSRVASLLLAAGLPIRRTQWWIDPAGARARVVKHVAADLGLPIVGEDPHRPAQTRTAGRFSWTEHLQTALKFLQFGHQVFEQNYREEDGLFRLHKLAPRPPQTIEHWNVARDGGLISIRQYAAGMFGIGSRRDGEEKPIPVDRLVVYVWDPDPGVWVGNSMLRPAYKHWLLVDKFSRIEAVTAERNGMGTPVAWAPDVDSFDSDRLAPYLDFASKARVGKHAGGALPAGADFKYVGVTGNLPAGFIRQAVEWHDKRIALVALAHFLNLDKGGSYALASVQEEPFSQAVQTIGEAIRDTAQKHVIEDLVDVNYGANEPAPRLVFDEVGAGQEATAQAMKILRDAGFLVPDEPLQNYVRQQYRLPAADPDSPPTVIPTPAVGGGNQPDMMTEK